MENTANRAKGIGSIFPIWDDLSPQEQALMQAQTNLQHFAAGDHIHGGLDDCMGVIMVVDGILRVYFLSPEGREITLFSLTKGETCLLSASCALQVVSFEIFIDAETDAEVLVTAPHAYDELMEQSIYVQAYSYKQIVERMSSVMKVMEQALFTSVDSRLATHLLAHADSQGCVHATHDAIARDVGSAREVVSRTLKAFERDALVSLDRGVVRIIDTPSLRQRTQRITAS